MLRKVFQPIPLHQRLVEDVKKKKGGIAATLCVPQEEVYNTQYFQTKDFFNSSIKSRKITREQILYIKFMLNEFLKEYKEFYPNRYKNDAHEIYSKLRSPFLDNSHYSKILKVLNNFTQ